MLDRLQDIDRAATLAINSLHTPVSDSFWQLMSDVKVWIPFYVAIIIWLIARLGPRKALVIVLSIVLTIVMCDQLANLVKDSAARLRPCYDSFCVQGGLHILERRTGLFGFFSAHAANAFGLAVCAIVGARSDIRNRYKGFAAMMIIWAILVAVSRVFVGKHFLGDILAGSVVGSILGYLTARLARQIMYRLNIS